MSRTSLYSPEFADVICMRLGEGESLKEICRSVGMPTHRTVLRWTDEHPEFSVKYTKAREFGYLLLADELLEIADNRSKDTVVDDKGNERMNTEWVARARLRVDTRKWILAKMLPKIFGEKLETTHRGGQTLIIDGVLAKT